MNEGDKWSSGACVTDRAARWPIASEERVEDREVGYSGQCNANVWPSGHHKPK